MTSRHGPVPAAGGGRVPLARSFAFRLGTAFAAVAIAAAGITALMVNAAFAARFDRYLAQQQHTQLTRLTAAATHAYAGGGKWDLRALKALAPAAGPAALRILTTSGQRVWQWDGHAMSWDSRRMQATGGGKNSGSKTGGSKNGGGSSGGQPGTGHDHGGWQDHGWMNSMPAPAASHPAAVLLAAKAPASPAASPPASAAALGPAQRMPIIANGKVVGAALVRLPPPSALPAAVAFRGQVIALVLAAGAAGALISLALGSSSPAAPPSRSASSPAPPRRWPPATTTPAWARAAPMSSAR